MHFFLLWVRFFAQTNRTAINLPTQKTKNTPIHWLSRIQNCDSAFLCLKLNNSHSDRLYTQRRCSANFLMWQIFYFSLKLLTETFTPRNVVKMNKPHRLAVGDDIRLHPSEAWVGPKYSVDSTTTKSKSEEMIRHQHYSQSTHWTITQHTIIKDSHNCCSATLNNTLHDLSTHKHALPIKPHKWTRPDFLKETSQWFPVKRRGSAR
jgi:hypothetical protein